MRIVATSSYPVVAKPSTEMEKKNMNDSQIQNRNRLALAAMLNTTFTGCLELFLENPQAIRDMLLHEAADWFVLNPESGQFDKDTFIGWLKSASLVEIVREMDQMGKNPFSEMPFPKVSDEEGHAVSMWEEYVKVLRA